MQFFSLGHFFFCRTDVGNRKTSLNERYAMYVLYELKKSVAFVQASLFYTQVFVFYFINNLYSVELVNKKIIDVPTYYNVII